MNIEKYTHIKRSELDEGDYFESLIVKAYELGFVTETDVESIQDACFELLAQNLRRTYGDTSASASTERAESMMDSVVYTLGVGLKTFKTPDEALDFLLEYDISTLFYRGMRRINEMISKIKEMADVLMYYNDVMLCYGITAEELKAAYSDKFEKNMKRW